MFSVRSRIHWLLGLLALAAFFFVPSTCAVFAERPLGADPVRRSAEPELAGTETQTAAGPRPARTRVRDAGESVGDAEIEIRGLVRDRATGLPVGCVVRADHGRETVADPDSGEFAIRADAAALPVQLTVDASGYRPATASVGQDWNGVLELVPAWQTTILVTTPDGVPVEGAAILARDGFLVGLPRREVSVGKTSADGICSFEIGQQVRVRCQRDLWLSDSLVVTPDCSYHFVLFEGWRLEIGDRDTGDELTLVAVKIDGDRPFSEMIALSEEAGTGPVLPSGSYRLAVLRDDRRLQLSVEGRGGDRSATPIVQAEPGQTVRVDVHDPVVEGAVFEMIDSATGLPIANADMFVEARRDPEDEARSHQAHTDDDGRYTWRSTGRYSSVGFSIDGFRSVWVPSIQSRVRSERPIVVEFARTASSKVIDPQFILRPGKFEIHESGRRAWAGYRGPGARFGPFEWRGGDVEVTYTDPTTGQIAIVTRVESSAFLESDEVLGEPLLGTVKLVGSATVGEWPSCWLGLVDDAGNTRRPVHADGGWCFPLLEPGAYELCSLSKNMSHGYDRVRGFAVVSVEGGTEVIDLAAIEAFEVGYQLVTAWIARDQLPRQLEAVLVGRGSTGAMVALSRVTTVGLDGRVTFNAPLANPEGVAFFWPSDEGRVYLGRCAPGATLEPGCRDVEIVRDADEPPACTVEYGGHPEGQALPLLSGRRVRYRPGLVLRHVPEVVDELRLRCGAAIVHKKLDPSVSHVRFR